ncbi:hypothetical protein CK203_015102 [Vitis vinifera]|uniref:Uncharacterized protein n=1 Tax=Vitis vinifera TaxID=29760 RepID=A0A438JCS0_VITVI|nr:hypothetical protein CK203_015102 [Vitis vinifera]
MASSIFYSIVKENIVRIEVVSWEYAKLHQRAKQFALFATPRSLGALAIGAWSTMADGTIDFPDDLLSTKAPDEHWTDKDKVLSDASLTPGCCPFSVRDPLFWLLEDEVLGGKGDGKVLMGLLDGLKDQATSESSIPLSPQWLYAKPVEAKILIGGTSGDRMLLAYL